MTPAIAQWPVWAHVAVAVGMAAIGYAAFVGCVVLADSPLGRHALGLCTSAACSRCVRKKRRQVADQMAREARR